MRCPSCYDRQLGVPQKAKRRVAVISEIHTPRKKTKEIDREACPKLSTKVKWRSKMWSVHLKSYYLVFKINLKNTAWRSDGNLLREGSQTRERDWCLAPLMGGSKSKQIPADRNHRALSIKPRTTNPVQPACPRDPSSLPPQCRGYRRAPHLPTFVCVLRSQTPIFNSNARALSTDNPPRPPDQLVSLPYPASFLARLPERPNVSVLVCGC